MFYKINYLGTRADFGLSAISNATIINMSFQRPVAKRRQLLITGSLGRSGWPGQRGARWAIGAERGVVGLPRGVAPIMVAPFQKLAGRTQG